MQTDIRGIKRNIQWRVRGARSSDFKIGFAGAATIIEVNTDRPWGIKYSNGDVPFPVYYVIRTSEYNYTNVVAFRE